MPKNATFYIFALALVALVGVIVLLCLNKTVPTELWGLAVALISGGLGIAQPTPVKDTASPTAGLLT